MPCLYIEKQEILNKQHFIINNKFIKVSKFKINLKYSLNFIVLEIAKFFC